MPAIYESLSTQAMALGLIFGCMCVLWIISVLKRDVSLVDPFWGTGFAIVAWGAVLWNQSFSARPLLLAALTTLWGIRLSLYLLWRNWSHDEDRRYAAMRTYYGPRFWWLSFVIVFLLQGVLMWLISWPQQFTAVKNELSPLGLIDILGVVIWTTGFLFESIGDFQLSRFKADATNAGKVMDKGLWRYTRHPNYFGNFCIWWGLYCIAASGGAVWTIVSPLLMSFLLLKVSGVSLLESNIHERRPDYLAYRQRTNAFFPGPPRKTA